MNQPTKQNTPLENTGITITCVGLIVALFMSLTIGIVILVPGLVIGFVGHYQ